VLVHAVADAILDRLEARGVVNEAESDCWMTTREAAAHIGRSVEAMHKLTAARKVPFSQDSPGGKCWFRKSDLDAWMRS
jgi:excisionase family DNA binding protein